MKKSDVVLYSVWCEWDVGHERLIFTSKKIALEWLKTAIISSNVLEEGETFETLIEDGLVGIDTVTLIGE